MSGTLVTLRPNGVNTLNSWDPSASTADVVTADDNNATYVEGSSTTGSLILDFGTFSLPALAQVRTVTARVKTSQTSGGNTLGFAVVTGLGDFVTPSGSIVIYSGQSYAPPNWAQADVDVLQMIFQQYDTSLNPTLDTLIQVYEAYIDVVYNQAPTATWSAPSGTITTTSTPTLIFTYSDPEADQMEQYQIKIFSAAQYGAVGFSADTSTASWDSGAVFTTAASGSSVSTTTGTALLNGVTYKAYVKVSDAGSTGRFSAWAISSTFTIAVNAPAVPSITATPDPTNARTALVIQGYDNMLTKNQSSLETNTVGWLAGTNTSISRSTAQFVDGVASLLMTPAGAGAINAVTPSGTSGVPVAASTRYCASAQLRASTNARSCSLVVHWYKSDGSASAVSASTTGTSVTDSTSAWTPAFVEAVSPSDAAYADIQVVIAGASGVGDTHYVDVISLRPGKMNLLTYPTMNARLDAVTNLSAYHSTLSAVDLTNSGTDPVLGSKAIVATQLDNFGQFGFHWNALTASPGQQFTLSFWAYSAYRVSAYLSFAGATDAPGPWVSAPQWTRISFTFTAPAGTTAVTAYAMFEDANATNDGKTGAIDAAQLEYSSSASPFIADFWTVGGLLPSQRFTVARSTDDSVAGSLQWKTLTRTFPIDVRSTDISDTTQTTTIYDYEAPFDDPIYYRLRTSATDSGNAITGDWSPPYVMASNLAPADCFWIKDPLDPTVNMPVVLNQHEFNLTRTESMGVHFALNRPDPVIRHGTVRYPSFPLSLWFSNDDDYYTWKTMQDRQRTLLLQTQYGDGGHPPDNIYFVLLEQVQDVYVTTDAMRSSQWRLVSFTAQQVVEPI